MRRSPIAITIAFTLLVTATGASGEIGDEAAEAEARLDTATAAVEAAETQRAVTLNDLVTAIDDWQGVVGRQTSLAFDVAGLRTQISAGERRASELKDAVRQRAVDAYMAGGVGMLDTLLVADSLSDIATAQIVLDSLGRQADADLDALLDEQVDLEALRATLAAEEDELAQRNQHVTTIIDELDILFADATADVAASHQDLLEADAEYRQAYELLQEMLALQRATGGGVERWRTIVEHYFPPERVQQAQEVMWCESRGNPKATHPVSDASGLFQFMAGTWEWASVQAGFDGASRYDPEANIASAAWLLNWSIESNHRLGDWGRWTCQPTTVVP